MSFLEDALRYARNGFFVFPLMPGTKKPYPGSAGFKDATQDEDQIRLWWTEHPDTNIGCWPGGSGYVVLDFDPGAEAIEDLPDTLRVKTPRGEHRYYHSEEKFGNRQLAPHIDVRASHGYTLLPPSVVDGAAYEWLNDVWIEELPAWVADRLRTPKPEPKERALDEIDTRERIREVYSRARIVRPGVIGEGSHEYTIKLVNSLLDLCSHEIVLDALVDGWLPRCLPAGEWDTEWLRDRVYSVKPGSGRGDDIGAGEDPEHIEWPKGEGGEKEPPGEREGSRFVRRKPSEYRDLPDPIFWDEDTRMIPRVEGEGATVLVYGQWGQHKTNVTLTWIMDMVAKGARVSYAAGEGARGVGKNRLPAHCRARGLDPWASLDDNLDIIEAVPRLSDYEDVTAFIDFLDKPDVVVIDTLATATAGEDENSSQFAAHLTDNGAIGRIKRAFKATVIVLAHEGKDSSRGARGHSGLAGNVDAGLRVSVPEENGCRIKVHVDKMRDGEAKFDVYYGIEPNMVPVPKRISEAEFEAMSPQAEKADDLWEEIKDGLKILGAHTGGSRERGVLIGELANCILQTRGDLPTEAKVEMVRKQIERMAKRNDRVRAYRISKEGNNWLWSTHVNAT